MKKWHAPDYDDQVLFDNGLYVFAERPDEFGPRAFMTLNLVWEDRETTFLTDAATPWGMAPWALSNARACMGLETIGSWDQVSQAYYKEFMLLASVCRAGSEDSPSYGGLMFLRTALRMRGLTLGVDNHASSETARHCLKLELERDSAIQISKARHYALDYPDWSPPKDCEHYGTD